MGRTMKLTPIRLGLIFFAAYGSYFMYCLAGDVWGDGRGQAAAAVLTYPAALLVMWATDPLAELVGPIGTDARRNADWVLILLAGTQYFVFGVFLGRWLRLEAPTGQKQEAESR